MNIDNNAISNAQQLFAWTSGQHQDSFFTLLKNLFGINCNFTSRPMDDQLREAMGAEQLCGQWRERMAQPTLADAEAFIRTCIIQLEQNAPQVSPPVIGMTEKKRSEVWATSSGGSVSFRSNSTDHWELQLCTEGETVYSEGAKQHLIKAGNIVLIPPGVNCSILRTPNTSAWHHYWCVFTIQPHWKLWCSLLQHVDGLTVLQLDRYDAKRFSQLIQGYIDYTYPKDPQWCSRAIYNRIESLLVELQAAQPDKPTPLDGRVQSALGFIQQRFRDNWGISDLASHSCLSPGRLSVLFKESLGASPMSLRDTLRMNEACSLLLNSQKSISQIGEETGYKDQMHFSRRFSEIIGQSPRKYRSNK